MQVVLLERVAKLGQMGEVVAVSPTGRTDGFPYTAALERKMKRQPGAVCRSASSNSKVSAAFPR